MALESPSVHRYNVLSLLFRVFFFFFFFCVVIVVLCVCVCVCVVCVFYILHFRVLYYYRVILSGNRISLSSELGDLRDIASSSIFHEQTQ